MPPLRQPLLLFLRRHPGWAVALLLGPALLWLLGLTLLPMGIMAYYSVLTRGPWGTITHTLTLDNYRQVVDPVFLHILGRSLRLDHPPGRSRGDQQCPDDPGCATRPLAFTA